MSTEQYNIRDLQRKDGETSFTYRNRIASELGQRTRIKTSGEDFRVWVEKFGEKGILTAYLGWQERFGANLSGDFQGIELQEGSAIIDENEGTNAFENALQKARGKEVDMRGIMRYIDQTLRELEHEGVDIKLKSEFKKWCVGIMETSRGLGKLAEELRDAS